MKIKSLRLFALITVSATLLGCAAANTALNKRELSVESKTSYSVVLEPVSPAKRIIYAKVRDLSGNSMRKPMQAQLENIFRSEGFTVTQDPDQANMMVTGTIIAAEKASSSDANKYLSTGYKGAGEGALSAAALGYLADDDHGKTAVGAALVGAAAGFLADTLVSDVYYTFVMDVQLRERPLDGDQIQNKTRAGTSKGASDRNTRMSSKNSSSVTRGENYNWIVHETRVVTTANKMNLKIEEAIPEVQRRTAVTISEMLM